ncbi:GntR family transcriptional regulator [Stieleria sp. JC731]|uniref:GntR family transcriptional regulator n=1 Tax=Pirellulaceae TaxID=2691357 RepID=UPI001E4D1133|nr:GntR family transcriptional regulator [Stieleria sp. JC731]MCC9602107.1 GntR family transcriptional regulator [Stieleria sp. JC731]
MPQKKSQPIVRERICDAIREALTERILNRSYKPGDKITELAIAEEFGTSQAPVREALRELEASGLVCTERYRGTRVREVSPRESAEAYRVRACLEALAARTALPELAEQLPTLRKCVQRMESAAKGKRTAVQAQQNHEFHRIIVESSGNTVLLRTWESLAFEARTHSRLKQKQTDPLDDAQSHHAIISAIENGDSNELAILLEQHSNRFASLIEDDQASEEQE